MFLPNLVALYLILAEINALIQTEGQLKSIKILQLTSFILPFSTLLTHQHKVSRRGHALLAEHKHNQRVRDDGHEQQEGHAVAV